MSVQAASLAMQVSDWLPSGLVVWGIGRHLLLSSSSIAACTHVLVIVMLGSDDAGCLLVRNKASCPHTSNALIQVVPQVVPLISIVNPC
jgi:hypothetical protein